MTNHAMHIIHHTDVDTNNEITGLLLWLDSFQAPRYRAERLARSTHEANRIAGEYWLANNS